jgi:hypothetical protein
MSDSQQLTDLAARGLSMGLGPRVGVTPNHSPPKEIRVFGIVAFLT